MLYFKIDFKKERFQFDCMLFSYFLMFAIATPIMNSFRLFSLISHSKVDPVLKIIEHFLKSKEKQKYYLILYHTRTQLCKCYTKNIISYLYHPCTNFTQTLHIFRQNSYNAINTLLEDL